MIARYRYISDQELSSLRADIQQPRANMGCDIYKMPCNDFYVSYTYKKYRRNTSFDKCLSTNRSLKKSLCLLSICFSYLYIKLTLTLSLDVILEIGTKRYISNFEFKKKSLDTGSNFLNKKYFNKSLFIIGA